MVVGMELAGSKLRPLGCDRCLWLLPCKVRYLKQRARTRIFSTSLVLFWLYYLPRGKFRVSTKPAESRIQDGGHMNQFIGRWDQLGSRPAAPAGRSMRTALILQHTGLAQLGRGGKIQHSDRRKCRSWCQAGSLGDWSTGKGRAGGVANESSTWVAVVPYPFESNQSDLSVQQSFNVGLSRHLALVIAHSRLLHQQVT